MLCGKCYCVSYCTLFGKCSRLPRSQFCKFRMHWKLHDIYSAIMQQWNFGPLGGTLNSFSFQGALICFSLLRYSCNLSSGLIIRVTFFSLSFTSNPDLCLEISWFKPQWHDYCLVSPYRMLHSCIILGVNYDSARSQLVSTPIKITGSAPPPPPPKLGMGLIMMYV